MKNNFNLNQNESKEILLNSVGTNIVFKGFCKKAFADGSLLIDFNGVDCHLNIDDFTLIEASIKRHIAQTKVGKDISFRFKSQDGDIINIERKSVIADERKKYDNLQVGHNIEAIVTAIDESKGVFVDIGGDIEGIIPKSMLERVFVRQISDHISIGEKVQVKVIDLERDNNGTITHLALNRKILLPSFEELVKDIQPFEVVIAKVKTVNPNGIHCSLNSHLDIFCGFVPGLRVNKDDRVSVRVKQIRMDRERINGDILGKL